MNTLGQTTPPSSPPNSGAIYRSALFLDPQVSVRPEGSPACLDCPASVWMIDQNRPKAYCSTLHAMTFGEDNRLISACEAKTAALLEYQSKLAQAES